MCAACVLFCATIVGLPIAAERNKPKGTVAEVRSYNGVLTLFVNNEPMVNLALAPIGDFPTDVCRDFGQAGIRIYTHIIWNWMNITPGKQEPLREANRWWLGEGRYDFDKFDRRLKAIIAAATMTTNLFRGLARYAGCHVYSTTDDVFNGNSRYLMLYTSSIGPKEISLPATYDVRDVVSNAAIGRAISEIRFDAKRVGEAHLFEQITESERP